MRVLFSRNLAFISKPRCGSTSVRRLLSKVLDLSSNDFGVDTAEQKRPYHPHITAPFLKHLLSEHYPRESNRLEYFTVIRNPIDMLRSYHAFFMPDENSRYNYGPNYSTSRSSFDRWIEVGRVGMNPEWKKRCPAWISEQNLSPLSLEAHVFDADSNCVVENIFLIEDEGKLEKFLSERLEVEVKLPHVNSSSLANRSSEPFSTSLLDKVRLMFPVESELYNI